MNYFIKTFTFITWYEEFQRLRELYPDMEDNEYCEKLFQLQPLAKIPEEEKQEIFAKHKSPADAYHFVDRLYS